jgi:hypothetical protein
VKRFKGKRPSGGPKRRWEDNIKMDLKEVGWGDMVWIDLTRNRKGLPVIVNAVMNLRVE